MNNKPFIVKIHEIKRPINLAYVLMSNGKNRFVSKDKLSPAVVRAYRVETSGEGGGQA